MCTRILRRYCCYRCVFVTYIALLSIGTVSLVHFTPMWRCLYNDGSCVFDNNIHDQRWLHLTTSFFNLYSNGYRPDFRQISIRTFFFLSQLLSFNSAIIRSLPLPTEKCLKSSYTMLVESARKPCIWYIWAIQNFLRVICSTTQLIIIECFFNDIIIIVFVLYHMSVDNDTHNWLCTDQLCSSCCKTHTDTVIRVIFRL